MLELIATIFSIIGNIFVIYKKWIGFVIWIISNLLWIIFGILNKHYWMIVLFIFYTIISIWGIYKWVKE